MASVKIDITGKFGVRVLSSKGVVQFEEHISIRDVLNRVNFQFGIDITPQRIKEHDIICVYNEISIDVEDLEKLVSDGDSTSFFQPLAGA